MKRCVLLLLLMYAMPLQATPAPRFSEERLANTTWDYVYFTQHYRITFKANGTFQELNTSNVGNPGQRGRVLWKGFWHYRDGEIVLIVWPDNNAMRFRVRMRLQHDVWRDRVRVKIVAYYNADRFIDLNRHRE